MTDGRLLKVEGAGNDFLVGLGDWADRLAGDAEVVARLCHRRKGIGADGVLALYGETEARLRLVYRNADGSPACFCANGTRCAARVGVELLGLEPEHVVVTAWAEIRAHVSGTAVALELPAPIDQLTTLDLDPGFGDLQASFLVLGVPHLVVKTRGVRDLDLTTVAPKLRRHPAVGAQGSNVSFVESEADGCLAIRTWERGVEGETLCCGSAVVAAALMAMAERRSNRLEIRPRSGDQLFVEALGEPPLCPSRLTGPARIVAEVSPAAELIRATS